MTMTINKYSMREYSNVRFKETKKVIGQKGDTGRVKNESEQGTKTITDRRRGKIGEY